jgi:hypothetical protein
MLDAGGYKFDGPLRSGIGASRSEIVPNTAYWLYCQCVSRPDWTITSFSVSRHLQNNFAEMLTRLHHSMGLGGFGEWNYFVDYRTKLSGL